MSTDETTAEELPGAAAPAPGATSEEDKTERRLTPAQWAEIEAHWEFGTMKAVEMSAKYGVTPVTLSRHFKRHGIIQNSKKHLAKSAVAAATTATAVATTAATPALAAAVSFESKRKERIEQTREQAYNASAANFAAFNRIQRRVLAFGAPPGAVPPGVTPLSPADADREFQALRHAEAFIETNIANRWRILKIDTDIDPDEIPVLELEDLSKQDIEQMRVSNGDNEDDGIPEEIELPGDDEEVVVEEPGPAS